MASDTFLKIEGIEGESTDDQHKKWIEILSFNHGVSQMASASISGTGGSSSERADFQDFSVVKILDTTSPLLALNCVKGTCIPEVKIELCRAGGDKQPYMEYKMTNVIISSVSIGGGGGGEPTESLTFNYGKFNWNYIKVDRHGKKSGNVPAGWDLEANKAI